MKQITLLIFSMLFFANLSGQTLTNVLTLDSLDIKIDGNPVENKSTDGRMLIAYEQATIRLFQNSDLTYWATFNYTECGKKVKLKAETYIELRDGTVIRGNRYMTKRKLSGEGPAWIIETNRDTIAVNSNKKIDFIAEFAYAMRLSN